MSDIAVSMCIEVLKKTTPIIADLVVKEGSRFSRMQEEISWIQSEMRHIQAYLKDAECKKAESERVASLIKDIRDLAFYVEDTMEIYFSPSPKVKGLRSFLKRIPHVFSNYYRAHNFLMEIEAIKIRVVDLDRKRQSYGINEQHIDQAHGTEAEDWNERRSFPHVEEPNITGFDGHMCNLVAKLDDEDSSLHVISITGLPGLGKTTLAKNVYNSVRRNFKLTAWIYVSEQPIIKNILKDIARQVGLKIDKWEEGSEAILYEHLSSDKYLLVIDDIWHTRAWDAMKNAIPTNSQNRSRIILTSRNRDVGVHAGSRSSLYELKPLGENYSKQLFESSLGSIETEADPPGLKEIADHILRRCGGVPLAIVVVSGLLKLRERSVTDWNGVLEQMDEGPDELSKTFTLSYIDLPINLKPCFLYFGIFPEDEEINTFDLINLWAAEGFIKGSDIREVEEVGDDYLNRLIARNLIQIVRKDVDGKVQVCRIHDILHSLCIRVANDISFFTTSTDLTRSNCEIVRRVTTHGMSWNNHICSHYRTSRLRSLFSFKTGENWIWLNNKALYDIQKDLHLARVLHFEGYRFRTFRKELCTLKNLTYLKLQIEADIPESIIRLESLITLHIQRSYSKDEFVIPMIIWNMKRLRHLLLQAICFGIKPKYTGFDPNAIQFQNFQTLQVPYEIVEVDWLNKLSKLGKLILGLPFGRKSDSLEKIANVLLCSNLVMKKLEILFICGDESDDKSLLQMTTLKMSGYQTLHSLLLAHVSIEQWPQAEEMPPNLTKIVLQWCVMKDDPLQVMKNLPKLRALILLGGEYSSGKLVCTGEPGNFPQLENFYIFPEEISEIRIEEGGMPKLKEFITAGHNVTLNLPPSIDRIWQHNEYDNKYRELLYEWYI